MRYNFRNFGPVILAAIIAGYSGSAIAQTPATPPTATPSGAAAIYDVIGTWKVERLWTSAPGGNCYKMDDQSALGSLMTVAPETIHWSYPGSHRFVEVGVCTDPQPALVTDANIARTASASIAPALPHFGIAQGELGPAYSMTCPGGGHWGPEEAGGNIYHAVGRTRMLMRWYDGAILLLKRYGD